MCNTQMQTCRRRQRRWHFTPLIGREGTICRARNLLDAARVLAGQHKDLALADRGFAAHEIRTLAKNLKGKCAIH